MRVAYVDIAKGIAILAVVMLHVNFAWPMEDKHIIDGFLGWAWHVPVFFVIGGFFINSTMLCQPRSFILSKIKSLYRLALYIYLPATLVHNFLFKIGWYSNTEVYGGKVIAVWSQLDYVKGVVLTLLCAGREPIVGAMWFVYVLLFALCGYSLITVFVKKFYGGGTSKFAL